MQSPATILRGSLGDIEKIPKWIPISEFVHNSVQGRIQSKGIQEIMNRETAGKSQRCRKEMFGPHSGLEPQSGSKP